MSYRMRVPPQNEVSRRASAYRTVDLGLAAFLAMKFNVESIEPAGDGSARSRFIFEDSRDVQLEAAQYWAHEAQVDPLDYFHQVKLLKTRIHEQRENVS